MTALDDVRVEVAFSTDPNTTTPTFVDLTSRARLDAGIDITRGRQDENDNVQAGQCSLTLDNTDGALTPGLASSPYYPNVKPQNRIRVTYRDPAVAGNLLSAESASFEGGTTGGWACSSGVTLGNSSAQSWDGADSLSVAWTGTLKAAWYPVAGLVVGRTYTWSAYVYVGGVTGSSVGIGVAGIGTSATRSSWNNTWGRLSHTFTATSRSHLLEVSIIGSTTRTDYVDGAMLDEGATLHAFTTDPAPIAYRFDGYVDEWPTAWPTGGQTESTSTVTAMDLQSRIGREQSLGSVIAETVKLGDPLWYFPLSEPDSSTSAGDLMGTGSTVTTEQIGTGGTLEFAAGTGPGTDSTAAPMFTPVDVNNGLCLSGRVPGYTDVGANGQTIVATFLTSASSVAQTVAAWSDEYGVRIELGTDATGKAVARFVDPWNTATNQTVTSATSFADGATHHGAVALTESGGTLTLTLTVDGAVRGTPATWSTTRPLLWGFSHLSIAGAAFVGRMFTGTISHVAGFQSGLALADLQEQHEAVSTGFSGERSDERIARIASWVGLPSGLLSLDVGQSTIAHVDSTGAGAWDYMQQVATTEAGLLFVSTDGMLTFYNRAHSYDTDAVVAVSVDAELVGPDTRIVNGMSEVANDVTVDRAGGATARVFDAESISTYRTWPTSVSLISDTDSDAFDRANWILTTSAEPRSRLPELTLDGLTDATTSPSVRWLALDDRVEVTGMPAQASAADFDLRVQGYRESIGRGGWFVTANLTPYLTVSPLILDDLVYGELDADNRLVY